MRVQFSIYRKNEETGEIIPGTLFVADDEHIFDLFEELELKPVDSEFPNLNYLQTGRMIEHEDKTYEITDFSITTGEGDDVLKIKVYVIEK